MSDDLRRKLGYDHMLEMAEIRAGLAAQGMTGTSLHFHAVATYEARHHNDPPYRVRQKEWLDRQQTIHTRDDDTEALLVDALRRIRDGHNDPRTFAREVLILLEQRA